MSAGIERIHGTTFTGYPNTSNVTGSVGSFISGYQLRWFRVNGNFQNTSDLEAMVRRVETVATVMVIGEPGANYTMLGLDSGTFEGRGDYTGYGDAGTNANTTLSNLLETTVAEFWIVNGGFDN